MIPLATILAIGGSLAQADAVPLPAFTDATAEAGLAFVHSFGDRELSNIVEGTGPGCAFFDYDGDGRLDIYLLNGCWMPEVSDNKARDLRGKLANALYRNEGNGRFADVTAAAGVGDRGFGMGASTADYDGDGDLDLYVLNYGPNVLYRNEGNGTFTDVSQESGLADPSWSLAAPWFDHDGDGDLDVYVVNYLEYDAGRFRDFYKPSGYPGPLSYNAQSGRLYRNRGDGTFEDVSEAAGVLNSSGRGMSAVVTDLDGDGRLDLYVANDASSNFYFWAKGDGTFEERALRLGLAFGEGGQGASSMGPVAGDVDGDGARDLFIPDMGYGCLLMNRGGMFVDSTQPSRIALACGQYTGWGAALFDYDADGWLDLFVANGNAHNLYPEEDVLLKNDGTGKFVDVSERSGPYFADFESKYVGRGAACADYDDDGDLDLLVMNLAGPAKLLRNDGGTNHWLVVAPWVERQPAGPAGSPAATAPIRVQALGAVVSVTVGTRTMTREVFGVAGYLSQSDWRAHFGLGRATAADVVLIRWPDGRTTRREKVPANRILIEVLEAKP
ncbi:MAG: CRTAC1 family protein [Planctomycetota bacterium]